MAAMISLHGMDPMRFMTTNDQFELLLMQAIAAKAFQLRDEFYDRHARHVAARISELFKK